MRTQTDGLGDEVSQATRLHFPGDEPGARQEFKQQTDVNYIMKRYGGVPQGLSQFGEVDYTLNLQEALTRASEAKAAYDRLPQELRQRYPSWPAILDATMRGEIQKIENEKPAAPVTEPPVPQPPL